MKLVYDGLLNPQTIEHIIWMLKDYPYFLEVSPNFPFNLFSKWANSELPLYPSLCEDCMGGKHSHLSNSYCMITKNGSPQNGLFLGFPTEKDRKAAVDAFGEFVLKQEPFKTEL